jgi:hypothetical protein
MAQRPALGLYRAMLRAAAKLPTKNRRMMAEDKIRAEFRKCASITDDDALHELFLVGNTHLDSLGSAPPATVAPDAVHVCACALGPCVCGMPRSCSRNTVEHPAPPLLPHQHLRLMGECRRPVRASIVQVLTYGSGIFSEMQAQHLTALAKMDMRSIKGVRTTLDPD